MTGRDDVIGETSTEEALAEFDFLGATDASDHRVQGDNSEWGKVMFNLKLLLWNKIIIYCIKHQEIEHTSLYKIMQKIW